MADLRLTGVHPALDGDYDIAEDFNKWELHCIKLLTGLAGRDLAEAFPKGDPDILVALGMVALMRAGKITSPTPWNSEQVQVLWTKGEIEDIAEVKEDPPEMPASSPDNVHELSGKNGSSGAPSTISSENQADDPSPTGAPA